MKVKKGDIVKVLSGKDKGKTGTILKVLRSDDKVIVEGINMVTIFEKKNEEKKKGGIKKIEAPIFASKVMKFDDSKKKNEKSESDNVESDDKPKTKKSNVKKK